MFLSYATGIYGVNLQQMATVSLFGGILHHSVCPTTHEHEECPHTELLSVCGHSSCSCPLLSAIRCALVKSASLRVWMFEHPNSSRLLVKLNYWLICIVICRHLMRAESSCNLLVPPSCHINMSELIWDGFRDASSCWPLSNCLPSTSWCSVLSHIWEAKHWISTFSQCDLRCWDDNYIFFTILFHVFQRRVKCFQIDNFVVYGVLFARCWYSFSFLKVLKGWVCPNFPCAQML